MLRAVYLDDEVRSLAVEVHSMLREPLVTIGDDVAYQRLWQDVVDDVSLAERKHFGQKSREEVGSWIEAPIGCAFNGICPHVVMSDESSRRPINV